MSIPSANKLVDVNPHTLGLSNNADIVSFTDDNSVDWEFFNDKPVYKTNLQNSKHGFDFSSGARLRTVSNINLSSVSTITVYAVVKNRATGLNTIFSFGVLTGGIGLYAANVNGSTMEAGIADVSGYHYKDFSERLSTFQLLTVEADKSTNPDTLNIEVDTVTATQTANGSNNFSGNFSNAKFYLGYSSAVFSGGDFQLLRFLAYSVLHLGAERSQVEDEFGSLYGLDYFVTDSTPPTVSITSPSTGGASISGNQNIVVSCADNIGVTQLDLMVDGEVVDTYTGSGITSHTFTLDTLRFANGDHVIKVRASDGTSTTDSSTITKTFANTFTITGDAKLPSSGSDIYTTNIPDPVWSKDSGGGSINASTGEYTAPSSGLGVAVLRATGEFNSTQTKNVLYGFPYVHNNGNSREFPYSELPEGYQFKARVKSEDEQGNTLGFTGWEEQP